MSHILFHVFAYVYPWSGGEISDFQHDRLAIFADILKHLYWKPTIMSSDINTKPH